MFHFKEQSRFEIQPIIEQKPFENPAVQSFFAKWCEINDSIQLQIIDRVEWERRIRKKGIDNILEKQSDGKLILFIPKDLQLWEMVGVIEVVDQHTFATKPERQKEVKEKLLSLAKIFQNAGIYIAKRLEDIHEGREISEALALEFYEYGQALASGKRPETEPTINDLIAVPDLTPEETEEIDRFLAGDKLFESRRRRVEETIKEAIAKDPYKIEETRKDLYENGRKRALAQFFKVAQRAFELERKSRQGELRKIETGLKPWQSDTPIHSAFLERIKKAITQKIETSKRELVMAIFRRGLEKLVREMRERGWKSAINRFFKYFGLDLQIEQKRLIDALRIPELRAQLEEVRKTGDLTKISQKEREITDIIQEAVSRFPYKLTANNPSEMVATQYINCVGASILGGALMKEVGLNYLVGGVPEHSILLLVTSDGNVEWRDMLEHPNKNWKLTDEMIEGYKEDGTPITVRDIVAFAHNPTPEGLMFDIKREKKKLPFPWVKKGQRHYLEVFGPEYGQLIQLLHITAFAFRRLGRYKEAIEAYRQAIALDPKDVYPYNGLGNALYQLGHYEESIEAYRKAIAINPKYAYSYYNLGKVLYELKRYKEAIEALKKFISLADNEKSYYLIKQAEKIIENLKSKLQS